MTFPFVAKGLQSLSHSVVPEDVDFGQEDTDDPPSGSSRMSRPETNFQAKAGEHIVEERIWDERRSAVLCIR